MEPEKGRKIDFLKSDFLYFFVILVKIREFQIDVEDMYIVRGVGRCQNVEKIKICQKWSQTSPNYPRKSSGRVWRRLGWVGEVRIFFGIFVILGYFWGIFGVFEYATKIGLYLESRVPKKKERSTSSGSPGSPKNLEI